MPHWRRWPLLRAVRGGGWAGRGRVPAAITLYIVERVPGGSPTASPHRSRRPFPQVTSRSRAGNVTPAAARRLAGLVTAAWATFDEVAAASPAELRKGPRGGGRDRDKLIDHVIGAEMAYARKLGVKLKQPAIDDIAAIGELRAGDRRRGGRPLGRLTRRAQRLDHALRGPPDRLARPRACLGDAGPGGQPGRPAGASRPAS